MKEVFADASYWIAVFLPRDKWHQQALDASAALGTIQLVTTEEVLTELLNFVASAGVETRRLIAGVVCDIQGGPDTRVMRQNHDGFESGVQLYAQRPDKKYGLTDCISFALMRRLGIQEVLTFDDHFVQEGFIVHPRRGG